jgi:hypothetical protein
MAQAEQDLHQVQACRLLRLLYGVIAFLIRALTRWRRPSAPASIMKVPAPSAAPAPATSAAPVPVSHHRTE